MEVKCSGPNCNRTFDAPEGHEFYFCSVECACYAGRFNVRTGWRTPPKDWDTGETDYFEQGANVS